MKRYQPRRKPFLARRLERKGKKKFLLTLILGVFLVYAMLAWMIPTLIGGLSVLNRFKPSPPVKSSITESASLAPPVLNIPYEATSTASIAVRGYAVPKSSVEIYVDDDLKTTTRVNDDGSFISDPVTLGLGTNNISGKTVDEKGNKSFSSKPIQILYDNEKPKLDLKEPQDNQKIKGGDKKVTVSGTTNSDKEITITANGIRLIVNSDGIFSQILDINEGENNIVVVATDTANNTTQITRKVIYEP